MLGIARSNLINRLNKGKTVNSVQNNKQSHASDNKLLLAIKTVLKERPTYGYRRVTILVNRQLRERQQAIVNHKRIYRVMKENQLLLAKYGKRPIRVHEGKIITLASNMRWCSDGFTIPCDNGDRVHVAFAMDTCDREAMGYVASTKGIDGEMIRDLMTECMQYRFGPVNHLPSTIQWLSDNGPCYVARRTVTFGRELGFEVCTTRPYNPESNGMAEAFVKTIKRDYVWFGDLSCAFSVMKQLPDWFNDYNNQAPHKGLQMRSPRQYISANQR